MSGVGARFASAAVVVMLIASMPAFGAEPQTAPRGSGINLDVTLSIDPVDPPSNYDPCGTATGLIAYTGERVRWCYRVTNNSAVTLTRHDLETVEFGNVLTNFPFSVAPGGSPYTTQVGDVTTTLTEEAIWTAYNPGPVNQFVATDSALITVRPGITLAVTLGIDPIGPPPADYCGTERAMNVPAGRTIRWCFRVTNRSSIARTRHTLQTPRAGTVIEDFPFTLVPNEDAFLTVTETMGSTNLQQTGTWTAFRPGPGYVSTVSGIAARALAGAGIFADGFD
jgi:hypothetical protein